MKETNSSIQKRRSLNGEGEAPADPLVLVHSIRHAWRPSRRGMRGLCMPRSGAALLLVLAFLSITVAVSYALIRSQFTSVAMTENAGRFQKAQDAAWAGASYALRQMHLANWSGTGTIERVALNNEQGFTVQYTAGDASLPLDDTTYPYRVTIDVTGYVAASDRIPETSYQMRVVVQLVPRKLSDEPEPWPAYSGQTLVQWDSGRRTTMEFPARVEGPAMLQATLRLFHSYPAGVMPPVVYAQDLGRLDADGGPDYRPFTGPVACGPDTRSSTGYTYLRHVMGVPTTLIDSDDTPAFSETRAPPTYRLYPGGPEYEIPVLASPLRQVVIGPDPRTNPLGVYRVASTLEIGDDVTMEGVLLSGGYRIRVAGSRVVLKGMELPTLADSTDPFSLPVVATRGEIEVGSGAEAQVQGCVVAENKFHVDADTGPTQFVLTGQLLTAQLIIDVDSSWPTSSSWWNQALNDYDDQKTAPDGITYFPEFVQLDRGLDPQSQIVIKPAGANDRYHWQDWSQPVFVAHPDDTGLLWSVVRWETRVLEETP